MKFYAALAALLLGVSAALAIPPRPTPYTFTTSKGETVKVTIHGAPRSHTYTLADDGMPLVRRGDRFFIPQLNPDGSVSPSSTEVSAEAVSALPATFDKEAVAARLRAQAVKKRSDIESRVSGGTVFPSMGAVRSLVLLVNYSDVKMTIDNPRQHFSDMLNKRGFSQGSLPGSVSDYFVDNSWGQFTPQFDVYGPVELPHNRAYYGGNDDDGYDARPHEMALHACRLLDKEIDFSIYDYDNDGKIDNVYVFYAGPSEADANGVSEDCVWPHSYDMDYLDAYYPAATRTFDGVRLNHYACSAELIQRSANVEEPDGPGSFIHEFSHVLGLPDLYATNGDFYYETPNYWSVLDIGCYLDVTPSYSAYERSCLGWLTPEEVTGPMSVVLEPLTASKRALRISTSNPDEFFILEARDQSGWDKSLSNRGLLIWHIDYDEHAWDWNEVNNDQYHQRVELIRADNKNDFSNLSSDPFPAVFGNKKTFSAESTPAFVSWADGPMTAWPITDIKRTAEDKNCVSFNIAGGASGITDIDADAENDGDAWLYDMRGVKVDAASAQPGVYIRRTTSGKVSKIIITGK